MADLTQKQKDYLDELAKERVFDMNNDDVVINALEQKVHQMEEHLKTYFHERVHFYKNTQK
ncbi:putative outer membrane protein [Providencia alcalifaciens]|nr:putative outer membrane protein [Providencia alcalifaciens]